jgi:hypothetical protein
MLKNNRSVVLDFYWFAAASYFVELGFVTRESRFYIATHLLTASPSNVVEPHKCEPHLKNQSSAMCASITAECCNRQQVENTKHEKEKKS